MPPEDHAADPMTRSYLLQLAEEMGAVRAEIKGLGIDMGHGIGGVRTEVAGMKDALRAQNGRVGSLEELNRKRELREEREAGREEERVRRQRRQTAVLASIVGLSGGLVSACVTLLTRWMG